MGSRTGGKSDEAVVSFQMSSSANSFQRRFHAATGYFELGILDEAVRELEDLPPEEKSRVEVMALRLVLSSALKNWEEAAAWGEAVIKAVPEEAAMWLQYAYAVRRARSIEAAEQILLQALKIHPNEATIRYNLACYACVSGKIPEAKLRLQEAFAREKDLRMLARKDEDLRILWSFVEDGD